MDTLRLNDVGGLSTRHALCDAGIHLLKNLLIEGDLWGLLILFLRC